MKNPIPQPRFLALLGVAFILLAGAASAQAGTKSVCRDVQSFNVGGVTVSTASGCHPVTHARTAPYTYKVGNGVTIINNDRHRYGAQPTYIIRNGVRYVPAGPAYAYRDYRKYDRKHPHHKRGHHRHGRDRHDD